MGRAWRTCATGLCFVLYGLLGWLAGWLALPLIHLFSRSPEVRARRVRALISVSFRWLLAVTGWLRLGQVEVRGRQWLQQARGKLVLASHPTYLDVVALIGLLPQASCVTKSAIWHNRLYRRMVGMTGYHSNADAAQLLDACIAGLRQGHTLIMFPEGTRSAPDQPLHFSRGAAQVAIRSQCDILPVIIRCQPLALGKNQPWYQAAATPWRLSIEVLPPRTLVSLGYREDWPHGVAARRLTRAMEDFFNHQLNKHEHTA